MRDESRPNDFTPGPAAGITSVVRIALGILLVTASLCDAATVRTLGGQSLSGDVSFADGKLLLTPRPGQPAQPLDVDDVLRLDFRAKPAAEARWRGVDIGTHVQPGSDRFVGNTATVRAAGAEMWGANQDHFRFVHQPLNGDGQVIARVNSIALTSPNAKAGLMFRATIDPASPHAFMTVMAGGANAFLFRNRMAAQTVMRDDRDASGPPLWVRVRRRGNNVAGYVSNDGNDWRKIGESDISLPPTALVGLAVSAHRKDAITTATFEKIQVVAGADLADAEPPRFSRGILMRDGTLLSAHIRSANDSSIRLYRDRDGEFAVPLTDVSRILFNPPTREAAVKLSQSAGKTGVILTSGDFFEGSVIGIDDSRIRVSSVLFGLKRYDTGQVVAAILRDPAPTPSKYEVRPADGSLIFADALTFEKDRLVVPTRLAGNLKFLPADLIDITAGSSRFQSLLDLKPTKVDAPPNRSTPAWAPDATTVGLPMSLGGKPAERGIGLSAGATLTYALDGNYRILILRLGVPDGVLPTNPVRFTLIADGKELFKSNPLTTLDDPAVLTVPIADVKQLTIRLDATLPDLPGGAGLVADPAVVK